MQIMQLSDTIFGPKYEQYYERSFVKRYRPTLLPRAHGVRQPS